MATLISRSAVIGLVAGCLAVLPAWAQATSAGSQPVGWSPSYSGQCADCDLTGLNLGGWTIAGANYSGARLDHAYLRSINAPGVILNDAIMSSSDMRHAVLTGAKLNRARMEGVRLQNARASGAEFREARLFGANLNHAVLVGANFAGADLMTARFESADLSGANLTGAALERTVLQGAILNGANLTDARLAGADITGASFRDAQLSGTEFSDVRGSDSADFSGACGSLSTILPPRIALPLCSDPLGIRPLSE